MSKKLQKELAVSVNINAAYLSQINSLFRHASYPLALRLASETGTDIELWLRGGTGTPEARKAAVKNWAEAAQQ